MPRFDTSWASPSQREVEGVLDRPTVFSAAAQAALRSVSRPRECTLARFRGMVADEAASGEEAAAIGDANVCDAYCTMGDRTSTKEVAAAAKRLVEAHRSREAARALHARVVGHALADRHKGLVRYAALDRGGVEGGDGDAEEDRPWAVGLPLLG